MRKPSDDARVHAYLHDCQRRSLSAKTINDRSRLLARFEAGIAPATVVDCTRDDIETWLDTCDLGPQGRYTYLSNLASFFRWMVELGHRDDDPTVKIRRPKLGRRLPRPIGDADLAYALSVADQRMRVWLALAAYEGLRCAEIANLRREDIVDDREPPLLVVRQGKGAKDRIVPLNPIVEQMLHDYGLGRRGWMFTLNNGRHIGAPTVSAYIGRFLHDLGIDASAHRGRHKFGSDVYRLSGGDIRLTQEMLGHSSPVTTAIYAAWDPVKAAGVVRQLGQQVGQRVGQSVGREVGWRPPGGEGAEHGFDADDCAEVG